jgi:Na+-transporting methylmalonyl-CoA/oxaloacetate decarboxylase gamma subunit
MRSLAGRIFLGIAAFGSVIAMLLFLVLLVTFERISEELMMVLWILIICFYVIGRVIRKYFDSMVNRGEVEPRDQEYWKEKARHWGPMAAPAFWWRAIAKPRERGTLPENYTPPTKTASP